MAIIKVLLSIHYVITYVYIYIYITFMMKMLRHSNRLPRKVVDTPSLEVYKVRLDGVLSNEV